MDAATWASIKALQPSAPRLVHDSATDGTYKQPDNLKRLRKQAVKDFGVRQIKRAVQKQRRLQQESSNA